LLTTSNDAPTPDAMAPNIVAVPNAVKPPDALVPAKKRGSFSVVEAVHQETVAFARRRRWLSPRIDAVARLILIIDGPEVVDVVSDAPATVLGAAVMLVVGIRLAGHGESL
jgi:hypothetical protein|tara:strand:- start:453 stop:785 length:333 start_codon:yes stop_codon:yes gene_type:complete